MVIGHWALVSPGVRHLRPDSWHLFHYNPDMIRKFIAFIAALALMTVPCAAVDESALSALLEGTKFHYTRLEAGLWTIPFEGHSLSSYNVFVTSNEGVVLVFVVVADHDSFEETPELVRALLRCNVDLDRIKVGIDDDGDVFARIDLTERILDARELSENIDQAAAAADEIYRRIAPYLASP